MYDSLDLFDEIAIYTDTHGNIIDANENFLNLIQERKESILGKNEKEIINIVKSSQNCEDKNTPIKDRFPLIIEEEILYSFGLRFYKTKKEFIVENKQEKILITRRDITEFKQYINLYHNETKILEYIAKGKPLEFVLDKIIKAAEEKNPKMMCSILLLDESKQKLIKCAAPSLPQEYSDKINGMKIGEEVGSCGAAVFLKQRVIVEDISTHKNWQRAKNLAAKFNLCACWSQPIFSSEREVLGSFAIYYKESKSPSSFDIDLIENIANITGIAIEKHTNNQKLKKEVEENKRQEQLLMHRSKQAMMGEMLENIAHQWRQPLSIISSYATGIMIKKAHDMCTEELEKDAFEVINLNAQYLSNTIDNFRNFFLSSSKKIEFSIEETISYTLKLVESRFNEMDIKLLKEIENIRLYSYKNELTQVFVNIFNNSADALESIDIEDRYIYIKSYYKNKTVFIEIIDSANGAKQEVLDRVFEPYFTTKHQNYGTGIGLYMCSEIIEKHIGGKIEAQNSSFVQGNKTFRGLKFIIQIGVKED